MSSFAKQQTIETFRANAELSSSVFNVSAEQAEASRKAYRAEKVRKYKIRLIDGWRSRARS